MHLPDGKYILKPKVFNQIAAGKVKKGVPVGKWHIYRDSISSSCLIKVLTFHKGVPKGRFYIFNDNCLSEKGKYDCEPEDTIGVTDTDVDLVRFYGLTFTGSFVFSYFRINIDGKDSLLYTIESTTRRGGKEYYYQKNSYSADYPTKRNGRKKSKLFDSNNKLLYVYKTHKDSSFSVRFTKHYNDSLKGYYFE